MPEISLYRKIDDEYCDELHANVQVMVPELTYINSEPEDVFIEYPDEAKESISINEYDDGWDPQLYGLHYHQSFKIGNPSAFFGHSEITDSANRIGVAVHIFSADSKFQKTMVLPQDVYDTVDSLDIEFDYDFEKSWMRGKINLEFFFFLKSSKVQHPFQANEEGMRLSYDNLFQTCLTVDGTGSTFPITEVENPGGPLWQMRKLWSDPLVDAFDASSVQIELNSKHPKFKALVNSSSTSNGVSAVLMEQIMAQAVAMIIAETANDMAADGSDFENDVPAEGSVAKVVQYWINLYDIDIKNDKMMTIFNKVAQGAKEDEA